MPGSPFPIPKSSTPGSRPGEGEGLTHADLLARLDYDPETGVFTWKDCRALLPSFPSGLIGQRAGHLCSTHNRNKVQIGGRKFYGNVLAWFFVHGEWPARDVDHANGDTADDRIANLRLATRSQNCANRRRFTNNTTGFKGVHWIARARKWAARCQVNGKSKYVGFFATREEAASAYAAYAKRAHGVFARVG